MASTTIAVNDISLIVYYDCDRTHDPLGTGDSPTAYEIEIHEIELADVAIDITSLLMESVLIEIEKEIIRIESN